MPAPVVYGYVRALVEDDAYVRDCKEQLATWCAREGWALQAVFTDCGGALDDDRVGFRGLLNALAMPDSSAAVVLGSLHLSPRADVVARLVRAVRRTGCTLEVRDKDLPEIARRLCLARP
ncbi:recombinase family protein [Actinokineospora sp. UTMC 2448]|uniref:recombinase family protein n=1 Tax=Actinokineospora sp. UTMC 2448 TaxID=2268449 RepID=UPI0021643127|nr:recombinase family protein [Actinokineospora sp. UTMC 2448]UVS80604.1 hypothetical protein Actkin_04355 [Actinokineospora sp. UTMC 2448]